MSVPAPPETQEARRALLETEQEAIREQYLALRGLRFATAVCAVGTMALGMLGLVGHLSSNWVLGSFGEGYKIMTPAVGLALALCGAAVLCLALPRRPLGRVIRVLALLVLIIAGVRIAEIVLGVDWNSSNLFLPPPWMPVSPDETPSALPTVVALFAAAMTFLLMRRRVQPTLTYALASVVTIVGAAFLLGYVYGKPLLYGTRLIPIALPAAIGVTLLGIALSILLAAGELAVRRLMNIRRAEDRASRDALLARQQREGTLLRLINEAPDAQALVDQASVLMREWFDCDALGIRWRRGDDYPYLDSSGFSAEHLAAESSVCQRDTSGDLIRDDAGRVAPECLCGAVLRGRTDPALPFFTAGGSFWTNSTTRLLAGSPVAATVTSARGFCVREGYESIALIPLRFQDTIYGLLQLNCKRPDRFTAEGIAFLERMASSMAVRLAQHEGQAERERLTEQAQRQATELETVFSATADGIVLYDSEGRVIRQNEAAECLVNYTPELSPMPLAKRYGIMMPVDEAGQRMAPEESPLGRALAGELVTDQVMRFEWLSEKAPWLLVSAAPLRAPDGSVTGAVMAFADITRLRQAEDELRSQRDRLDELSRELQTIMDNAPDGIVFYDQQGNILRINQAARDILGYSDEVIPLPAEERFRLSDVLDEAGQRMSPAEGVTAAALRGETVYNQIANFRNTPRGSVWISVSAAPTRSPSGEVDGVVVVFGDITALHEAQEELRAHRDRLEQLLSERTAELARSERQYRELVQTANSAIIRWHRSGRIAFVNEYAETLFGYEPGELLGKPIGIIVPEVDEAGRDLTGLIDAIVADPAAFEATENENVTKDGRRLWLLWSARALLDEQGDLESILAIATDRTAQHEAEKKLEANQRRLRAAAAELSLAEQRERQRLAAALHDELAQTLGVIKLQSSVLQSSMPASVAAERLAGIITMVDMAVRQSRAVMADLSPPVLHQQGLIEALRWWAGQIKQKHGLEVTVEVEGTMERLAPDVEATLFQAVKELLQNTVKYARATQAGIHIRCGETHLDIDVTDNGVGFDVSAVETTEKGGFGLFSVRARMAYLGGDFLIDSAPGKGTRSTISLPLPCVASPGPDRQAETDEGPALHELEHETVGA